MRYSATQKAETHRKILEKAADALRANGANGVSVADVMALAGLTHGGFYAHFKNKDELVVEAVEQAFAQTARLLKSASAGSAEGTAFQALIDTYLNVFHRDNPSIGCILPPLAADMSRAAPQVRERFTGHLKHFLEQLGGYMPAPSESAKEEQMLAVMASLVGAMVLARAVADPELSARFLEATRRLLSRCLENRPATATP